MVKTAYCFGHIRIPAASAKRLHLQYSKLYILRLYDTRSFLFLFRCMDAQLFQFLFQFLFPCAQKQHVRLSGILVKPPNLFLIFRNLGDKFHGLKRGKGLLYIFFCKQFKHFAQLIPQKVSCFCGQVPGIRLTSLGKKKTCKNALFSHNFYLICIFKLLGSFDKGLFAYIFQVFCLQMTEHQYIPCTHSGTDCLRKVGNTGCRIHICAQSIQYFLW